MRIGGLFALSFALASCAPEPPGGQVLARVDGVDITRRDLLVELTASGAPADVDVDNAQPAMLDRIVARTILVAEAKRQAVDRSPEYLGLERRGRDLLLVEQLRQRIAGRLPAPSGAEIDRYLAQNARAFDERSLLQVDRIAAEEGKASGVGRALSNDDVAKALNQQGRNYGRGVTVLDSLDLPPVHVAALMADPGKPVALHQDGQLFIDQLLANVAAPPSPTERRRIAVARLTDIQARAAFDRFFQGLKVRAKIDYQPVHDPRKTAKN